jgi:hypothetical protein
MSRAPTHPLPLQEARAKTEQVQRDLEVASAELGLAHGALDRNLPPEERSEELDWAITQNAELERKVQEAAVELEEVTELLDKAQAAA